MGTFRLLAPVLFAVAAFAPAQIIDYHQHLYSPVADRSPLPGWKGVTASELIPLMDEAGVSRAVVLSTAYSLANPHKPPVPNEREAVRKDNEWTSAQVAMYPDRLTGFCSVNPLKPYAVEEINRCARDPNLRTGLKLHFGNSDVDVHNPTHLAQLKRVFGAANSNRMAILVHAHANVNLNRPYGSREARVFLEQLLPETPDITVVLAHMAGAGDFDESTQQASAIYAESYRPARSTCPQPLLRCLHLGDCRRSPLLAQRIREIGVSRIFYGSDAPIEGNFPAEALARWHKFPLTAEEFRSIETNLAPFLRPVPPR